MITVWKVARREADSERMLSLFHNAYPDYAIEYVVGQRAVPRENTRIFCFDRYCDARVYAMDQAAMDQVAYGPHATGSGVVLLECETEDWQIQRSRNDLCLTPLFIRYNTRSISSFWKMVELLRADRCGMPDDYEFRVDTLVERVSMCDCRDH